jgi:hypothetical protein
MPKPMNLTGRRFGHWLVLERRPVPHGNTQYLCRCDCGVEKLVLHGNLRGGISTGCRTCKGIRTRKRGSHAAVTRAYHNVRNNAARRGLNFRLTREEYVRLASQPCHYCGAEPRAVVKCHWGAGRFICNGIDRVDNREGYVTGNMVACCKRCNLAKRDMTVAEFLRWARQVAGFNPSSFVAVAD